MIYYCLLWKHYADPPIPKFVTADSPYEVIDKFIGYGYVSISITDVTNMEVSTFEL